MFSNCKSNQCSLISTDLTASPLAMFPSSFALCSWSDIIMRRKMRRRRRVVRSVLWSLSVCMEDVVLHYQPGSAAGLSSVLERTEKLLESFPCRTPPVFTPWFPTAADRHLPIRPAKPAPVITCSGGLLSDSRTHSHSHSHTAQNTLQEPEVDGLVGERPHDRLPENPQEPKDVCVSETPNHLVPEREVSRLPPDKHKDGLPVTDSPHKRSWSIFTQRGVLQSAPSSLSKQFHHMVSVHRLHLHQRVKWVISQHNCGAARDIEQVSKLVMEQD